MRHVALLIPYRLLEGGPSFFFQVRDAAAPTYPSQIGIFGGHVEPGETPEQAVVREAAEELSVSGVPFALVGHRHLHRHEEPGMIRDIYTVAVDDVFALGVGVHEGDGGVWLTVAQAERSPRVADPVRAVLPHLSASLSLQPAPMECA